MKSNPYINGLGAAAYVWGIGLLISYISSLQHDTPDNFVGSISALSLVVFSAAVMAFLFFYGPAVLLATNKPREAISFFLKTLGVFGALTLLAVAAMLLMPVSTQNQSSVRVMDVKTYVTNNISELPPTKEQLGGTFYVTKIEAADGKGVVEYEDGHNAYVADFAYTVDTQKGITMQSFVVRQ